MYILWFSFIYIQNCPLLKKYGLIQFSIQIHFFFKKRSRQMQLAKAFPPPSRFEYIVLIQSFMKKPTSMEISLPGVSLHCPNDEKPDIWSHFYFLQQDFITHHFLHFKWNRKAYTEWKERKIIQMRTDRRKGEISIISWSKERSGRQGENWTFSLFRGFSLFLSLSCICNLGGKF